MDRDVGKCKFTWTISLLSYPVEEDSWWLQYGIFRAALDVCLSWLGSMCGLYSNVENKAWIPTSDLKSPAVRWSAFFIWIMLQWSQRWARNALWVILHSITFSRGQSTGTSRLASLRLQPSYSMASTGRCVDDENHSGTAVLRFIRPWKSLAHRSGVTGGTFRSSWVL